jgi:hypothetical protein
VESHSANKNRMLKILARRKIAKNIRMLTILAKTDRQNTARG